MSDAVQSSFTGTTELLKLADRLDDYSAIADLRDMDWAVDLRDASTAIRAAAQAEQEPFAWRWSTRADQRWRVTVKRPVPTELTAFDKIEPLYTSPQPAGIAYSSQDTLKMVAGMFAESVHETYTREEVVSIVEDMIRVGSPVSSTHRVCAKCGCETKGEEALVDGKIWCHPCADGVVVSSTQSGGAAK